MLAMGKPTNRGRAVDRDPPLPSAGQPGPMKRKAKGKKARSNARHIADVIDETTGELIAEAIDVDDPETPNRKARTIQRVPPIKTLYRRKSISRAQYDTARRFAEDYALSGLMPKPKGSNYEASRVDQSRTPEITTAVTLAAEVCLALERAMADRLYSVMRSVVGEEMLIKDWLHQRAASARWGACLDPEAATQSLRDALDTAAKWYARHDRGFH